MREISSFKRTISLIVVVCFLTTNAMAMPAQTLVGGGRRADVEKIKTINIPSGLGSIIETYDATRLDGGRRRADGEELKTKGLSPSSIRHPSSRSVIYIQDAHDSLEAQENIAGMVQHFVKEYGVRTVYEEGYEGPVPTDKLFGAIKDASLKEKISYYLMDKLRVGGAEYAHINRKQDGGRRMAEGDKTALLHPPSSIRYSDFDLIGADNINLHIENIRAYEQAAKKRDSVTQDIQRIRKELQKLIDKNFPKEMKEWLKLKERYQNGQLPLIDYLKRIYPLRGTGNVERETQALTVTRLPFPGVEALLSGDEKKIKRIDLMTLLAEIKQLEDEIVDEGLPSERAASRTGEPRSESISERDRKTYGYYQSVLLLEKLNNIQMSAEEYAAMKASLEGLKTEDVARFVAKESRRSLVLFRSWENLITDAVGFYELAKLRDLAIEKILFQTTDQRLETADSLSPGEGERVSGKSLQSPVSSLESPNTKIDVSVLVFGGFHKEAIKKILKEKGISYVILSPAIGAPSKRHQDYYRMLMSGGKYSFETLESVSKGPQTPDQRLRATDSPSQGERDGVRGKSFQSPVSGLQSGDSVANKSTRPQSRARFANHLKLDREATCPQRAVTMDYAPALERLAKTAVSFRNVPDPTGLRTRRELRQDFILKMDRAMADRDGTADSTKRSEAREQEGAASAREVLSADVLPAQLHSSHKKARSESREQLTDPGMDQYVFFHLNNNSQFDVIPYTPKAPLWEWKVGDIFVVEEGGETETYVLLDETDFGVVTFTSLSDFGGRQRGDMSDWRMDFARSLGRGGKITVRRYYDAGKIPEVLRLANDKRLKPDTFRAYFLRIIAGAFLGAGLPALGLYALGLLRPWFLEAAIGILAPVLLFSPVIFRFKFSSFIFELNQALPFRKPLPGTKLSNFEATRMGFSRSSARSEARDGGSDFGATIQVEPGQERFKIGKVKMDLFGGGIRTVPFKETKRMYGVAEDPRVLALFVAGEEKERMLASGVLEGQFTDIHVPGALAFVRCYVRGKKLVVAEAQSDVYPFLKKDETTRLRYKDWRKVMRLVTEVYARTLPGIEEIVSPFSETIIERWPERAFPGIIARLQHYGNNPFLTKLLRKIQKFLTLLMRPMIKPLFSRMGESPFAERMKKRLYMKALDPELARIVYDQNMPDFGYALEDLPEKISWEGGVTLKRAWTKRLHSFEQDPLIAGFFEHLKVRSVTLDESKRSEIRSEMRDTQEAIQATKLDLGRAEDIWVSFFTFQKTKMHLFKMLVAAALYQKAEAQPKGPDRESALSKAVRFLAREWNHHFESSHWKIFFSILNEEQGFEDFASYATREKLSEILEQAIPEPKKWDYGRDEDFARLRAYANLIERITAPSSRSETRVALDQNARVPDIAKALEGLLGFENRDKRRTAAKKIQAAVARADAGFKVADLQKIQELVNVKAAELEKRFTVGPQASRPPPAAQKFGLLKHKKTILWFSAALFAVIAAVIFNNRAMPDSERIAKRFEKVASGIENAGTREAAGIFVREFRKQPQVDKTLMNALQVHPFVRVLDNAKGELKGIQVNEDFALNFPPAIVKYILIHEATHLKYRDITLAMNKALAQFMARLKLLVAQKGLNEDLLEDEDLAKYVVQVFVNWVESEWFACHAEDLAIIEDVRAAGDPEVFTRKLLEGLGNSREDQRRNALVVSYLEGLPDRRDPVKGEPSEERTKVFILKSMLATPYLEQGQPHLHHLRNSFLQYAYLRMKGTSYEGTLELVRDIDQPVRVKDPARLVRWTYEEAGKLGVSPVNKANRSEIRQKEGKAEVIPDQNYNPVTMWKLTQLARKIIKLPDLKAADDTRVDLQLAMIQNTEKAGLLREILAADLNLWPNFSTSGKRKFAFLIDRLFAEGYFNPVNDPGLLIAALKHPSYAASYWAAKKIRKNLEQHKESIGKEILVLEALFDQLSDSDELTALDIGLILSAFEPEGIVRPETAERVRSFLRQQCLHDILRATELDWLRAYNPDLAETLQKDWEVRFSAKKGIAYLREIDGILRADGAVGLLVGSTALELFNKNATEEGLKRHSDIDILILRKGTLAPGKIDGFDLFMPHTVSGDQTVWLNRNRAFVRALLTNQTDHLPAGLYLPSEEGMVDLIYVTALASRFKEHLPSDIKRAFREKIRQDINDISSLWTGQFGTDRALDLELSFIPPSTEILLQNKGYAPAGSSSENEIKPGKYEQILNKLVEGGGRSEVREQRQVEAPKKLSWPRALAATVAGVAIGAAILAPFGFFSKFGELEYFLITPLKVRYFINDVSKRTEIKETYLVDAKAVYVPMFVNEVRPREVPLYTDSLGTCYGLAIDDPVSGRHFLAHLTAADGPEEIRDIISANFTNRSGLKIYIVEGSLTSQITSKNIYTALENLGIIGKAMFLPANHGSGSRILIHQGQLMFPVYPEDPLELRQMKQNRSELRGKLGDSVEGIGYRKTAVQENLSPKPYSLNPNERSEARLVQIPGEAEGSSAQKAAAEARQVDITKVIKTIRDHEMSTCLANSTLLIYILRSLGEKASLLGMFREKEDIPFQYLVETGTWGAIDITPYDEEVDNYERTGPANENDYKGTLADLRANGHLARIDKNLRARAFMRGGSSRSEMHLNPVDSNTSQPAAGVGRRAEMRETEPGVLAHIINPGRRAESKTVKGAFLADAIDQMASEIFDNRTSGKILALKKNVPMNERESTIVVYFEGKKIGELALTRDASGAILGQPDKEALALPGFKTVKKYRINDEIMILGSDEIDRGIVIAEIPAPNPVKWLRDNYLFIKNDIFLVGGMTAASIVFLMVVDRVDRGLMGSGQKAKETTALAAITDTKLPTAPIRQAPPQKQVPKETLNRLDQCVAKVARNAEKYSPEKLTALKKAIENGALISAVIKRAGLEGTVTPEVILNYQQKFENLLPRIETLIRKIRATPTDSRSEMHLNPVDSSTSQPAADVGRRAEMREKETGKRGTGNDERQNSFVGRFPSNVSRGEAVRSEMRINFKRHPEYSFPNPVYVMHKPAGVTSSAKREPFTPDVPAIMELVPGPLQKDFIVLGRLDKPTTGLILLGPRQGSLDQVLLNPGYAAQGKVAKVYRAWVNGKVTQAELDALLRDGVEFDAVVNGKNRGKKTGRFLGAKILAQEPLRTRLEVVLDEGKYRQIRRMMANWRHGVLELERVAVGDIQLGDLPAGQIRELTEAEYRWLEGVWQTRTAAKNALRSEGRELYAKTLKRLNPSLRIKEGEGLERDNAAYSLRHIDLLKLLLRVKQQLPSDPQVLVLGPGMTATSMEKAYSPQMIETLAVLNGLNAEYTVIDRSRKILDAVQNGSVYEYSPKGDERRYLMEHPELEDSIKTALASVMRGVSAEEIDWFGRYDADLKSQSIATFQGEFQDIEYGDAQADMIIGVLSIIHALKKIQQKEMKWQFVSKLIRALKPGGYLLMGKDELWPLYRQDAKDKISSQETWTPEESLQESEVILKQLEHQSQLAGDSIGLRAFLQEDILQIEKTSREPVSSFGSKNRSEMQAEQREPMIKVILEGGNIKIAFTRGIEAAQGVLSERSALIEKRLAENETVLAELFYEIMSASKEKGFSQALLDSYHERIVSAIKGMRESLIGLSVGHLNLPSFFDYVKKASPFCGHCHDVTNLIISRLAEKIREELGILLRREEITLGDIRPNVPEEKRNVVIHSYFVINNSIALDLTAGQYFADDPEKTLLVPEPAYRDSMIAAISKARPKQTDPAQIQKHFTDMAADFQKRLDALIGESGQTPAESRARSEMRSEAGKLKRFLIDKDLEADSSTQAVIDLLKAKEEEIFRILTRQMGVSGVQRLTLDSIRREESTSKAVYRCAVRDPDGRTMKFGLRFFPAGEEHAQRAREEIAKTNALAEMVPGVVRSWHSWEASELKGKISSGLYGANRFSIISIGEYLEGSSLKSSLPSAPVKEWGRLLGDFGRFAARMWVGAMENLGGELRGYFDTDDPRWDTNFGRDKDGNFFFFDGGGMQQIPIVHLMDITKHKARFTKDFDREFWKFLKAIVTGKGLSAPDAKIRRRLAEKDLLEPLAGLLVKHKQMTSAERDAARSEMREQKQGEASEKDLILKQGRTLFWNTLSEKIYRSYYRIAILGGMSIFFLFGGLTLYATREVAPEEFWKSIGMLATGILGLSFILRGRILYEDMNFFRDPRIGYVVHGDVFLLNEELFRALAVFQYFLNQPMPEGALNSYQIRKALENSPTPSGLYISGELLEFILRKGPDAYYNALLLLAILRRSPLLPWYLKNKKIIAERLSRILRVGNKVFLLQQMIGLSKDKRRLFLGHEFLHERFAWSMAGVLSGATRKERDRVYHDIPQRVAKWRPFIEKYFSMDVFGPGYKAMLDQPNNEQQIFQEFFAQLAFCPLDEISGIDREGNNIFLFPEMLQSARGLGAMLRAMQEMREELLSEPFFKSMFAHALKRANRDLSRVDQILRKTQSLVEPIAQSKQRDRDSQIFLRAFELLPTVLEKNKNETFRSEVRGQDEEPSRVGFLDGSSWSNDAGSGEQLTNEDITALITALEGVDIQGGGFLGVGSFHNLDIALDRGAGAIVLVDSNPDVVRLNMRILEWVERSKDPAELKKAVEERKDLFEAIRDPASAYRGKSVTLGRTPLLWLTDERQFYRLKQLIDEKKVAVALADLTKPGSMRMIGEFFAGTGIPLRLINLSNVEGHMEHSGGLRHLAQLPSALISAGANDETKVIAAVSFDSVFGLLRRNQSRAPILTPTVVPLSFSYDNTNGTFQSSWFHVLRTMADMKAGILISEDLRYPPHSRSDETVAVSVFIELIQRGLSKQVPSTFEWLINKSSSERSEMRNLPVTGSFPMTVKVGGPKQMVGKSDWLGVSVPAIDPAKGVNVHVWVNKVSSYTTWMNSGETFRPFSGTTVELIAMDPDKQSVRLQVTRSDNVRSEVRLVPKAARSDKKDSEKKFQEQMDHLLSREFLEAHSEDIKQMKDAIGLDLRAYSRDDKKMDIQEAGRDIVDLFENLTALTRQRIKDIPDLRETVKHPPTYVTFIFHIGKDRVELIAAARYDKNGEEYHHFKLQSTFDISGIEPTLIYGTIEDAGPRDAEGKINILFLDQKYPTKKAQVLASLLAAGGIPVSKKVTVTTDSGSAQSILRLSDMLPPVRSEVREQDRMFDFLNDKSSLERYMQTALDFMERQHFGTFRFAPMVKVGALLVDGKGEIVAAGVNGMGQQHAERMAILKALERSFHDQQVAGTNLHDQLRTQATLDYLMLSLKIHRLLQQEDLELFVQLNERLGNPLSSMALFVTLEPCERCERFIERLGIKRVVFGHSMNLNLGRPLRHRLKDLGIQVIGGIYQENIQKQYDLAFFFARKFWKTYVVIKELQRFIYSRYAAWRYGKEFATLGSKLKTPQRLGGQVEKRTGRESVRSELRDGERTVFLRSEDVPKYRTILQARIRAHGGRVGFLVHPGTARLDQEPYITSQDNDLYRQRIESYLKDEGSVVFVLGGEEGWLRGIRTRAILVNIPSVPSEAMPDTDDVKKLLWNDWARWQPSEKMFRELGIAMLAPFGGEKARFQEDGKILQGIGSGIGCVGGALMVLSRWFPVQVFPQLCLGGIVNRHLSPDLPLDQGAYRIDDQVSPRAVRSEVRSLLNLTVRYTKDFYDALNSLYAPEREDFMRRLHEWLASVQHTDRTTGVGKPLSALSSGYSELKKGQLRIIFKYEIATAFPESDPRRRKITLYLYWYKKDSAGAQNPLDDALSDAAKRVLRPDRADEAAKIRELDTWLYDENHEGLIDPDDLALVLAHFGDLCFGPVQYAANLTQLAARDEKGVTFFDRNLKARFGPAEIPLILFAAYQMQEVLQEAGGNLDRAVSRWLGNGGRFSESMVQAAKRLLEQWIAVQDRLLFLVSHVELRQKEPDFSNIASLYFELAGPFLQGEIRNLVRNWVKGQPQTTDGLTRSKAGYAKLQEGNTGELVYRDEFIEVQIRERQENLSKAPPASKPAPKKTVSEAPEPVAPKPVAFAPTFSVGVTVPAPKEAFKIPESPQLDRAIREVKEAMRSSGLQQDLITDEKARAAFTLVLDPANSNTAKAKLLGDLLMLPSKNLSKFRRQCEDIGFGLGLGAIDAESSTRYLKGALQKVRAMLSAGNLAEAGEALAFMDPGSEILQTLKNISGFSAAETREFQKLMAEAESLKTEIGPVREWLTVADRMPETRDLGALGLLVSGWQKMTQEQRDLLRAIQSTEEKKQRLISLQTIPVALAAHLLPFFTEVEKVEGGVAIVVELPGKFLANGLLAEIFIKEALSMISTIRMGPLGRPGLSPSRSETRDAEAKPQTKTTIADWIKEWVARWRSLTGSGRDKDIKNTEPSVKTRDLARELETAMVSDKRPEPPVKTFQQQPVAADEKPVFQEANENEEQKFERIHKKEPRSRKERLREKFVKDRSAIGRSPAEGEAPRFSTVGRAEMRDTTDSTPDLQRELVLVNLIAPKYKERWQEPLAVETLAAYMRAKVPDASVSIVDMYRRLREWEQNVPGQKGKWTEQRWNALYDAMFNEIKGKKPPRVVGLSAKWGSLKVLDALVARFQTLGNDRPLIVIGNTMSTFGYQELLERYPDYGGIIAVVGDGEEPLEKIYDKALSNTEYRNISLYREIPGIAFVDADSQKVVFNKPKKGMDLTNYPKITKKQGVELFRDDETGSGYYGLETSRGCPWGGCTFCSIQGGWRPFELNWVFDRIKKLIRNGAKAFYIVDSEFVGPVTEDRFEGTMDRVAKFATDMIEINNKQVAEGKKPVPIRKVSVRVDNVVSKNSDPEKRIAEQKKIDKVFPLLREAGVEKLYLGIESGDVQQLIDYNKGVTIDQNKLAIRNIRKWGFDLEVGFIFIHPEATIETLWNNIKFIKTTNLYETDSRLFGSLRIQAGSRYAKDEDRKTMKLDSLSFPDKILDPNVREIRNIIEEWEKVEDGLIKYFGRIKKHLTRKENEEAEGSEEDRRIRECIVVIDKMLLKLRKLDFEFVKGIVESYRKAERAPDGSRGGVLNAELDAVVKKFVAKRKSLFGRIKAMAKKGEMIDDEGRLGDILTPAERTNNEFKLPQLEFYKAIAPEKVMPPKPSPFAGIDTGRRLEGEVSKGSRSEMRNGLKSEAQRNAQVAAIDEKLEAQTQTKRSEFRLAAIPETVVSPDRAEKSKQTVRKAIENLRGKFTIMTDMADVANFTDAQLREFETMAILRPNVKFVFYGDGAEPSSTTEAKKRLEQLQRELGANRIVITESGAEELALNKGEKVICIAKGKGERGMGNANKKIFQFRYIAEETGLVPMALLYADQHEKPSEKGMMDLSMVREELRVAIQEFQNSVVFARAA